jgi:hypothetical protein
MQNSWSLPHQTKHKSSLKWLQEIAFLHIAHRSLSEKVSRGSGSDFFGLGLASFYALWDRAFLGLKNSHCKSGLGFFRREKFSKLVSLGRSVGLGI